MTQLLQVRRDAITTAELSEMERRPLADGEVRVQVGRWALTANNISYALTGNTIAEGEEICSNTNNVILLFLKHSSTFDRI